MRMQEFSSSPSLLLHWAGELFHAHVRIYSTLGCDKHYHYFCLTIYVNHCKENRANFKVLNSVQVAGFM